MCSTYFGHSYIHNQEIATILLNYHIGRIVLGSMCVGVSVWLVWSCIRFEGWRCASACNTDTTPTQHKCAAACNTDTTPTQHNCASACNTDTTPTQHNCALACNTDTTPTQPHRNFNTRRTKNNTTNVVLQQNSRKLRMMAILMSETCWAHKKWNKIASDIKLVFYSSTITILNGPLNIR